jgi:nitrite reductase/ring-hydroxylating ferredoxin subunit
VAKFLKIARRDEFKDGQCRLIEIKGAAVVIISYRGEFYAIADKCLHQGASLADGDIYGNRIVCPLHGWEYDFTNGRNIDDPSLRLSRYNLRVEGDDILIEI